MILYELTKNYTYYSFHGKDKRKQKNFPSITSLATTADKGGPVNPQVRPVLTAARRGLTGGYTTPVRFLAIGPARLTQEDTAHHPLKKMEQKE
jgi:hypothetical protein